MTLVAPRPPGATRVVTVRHGEPAAEARGRCYGRLDMGLSTHGRLQAAAAAAWVAALEPVAVHTSPRLRARQSAEPLRRWGCPVAVIDDLREIDFGAFEGLTYDEAAALDPDVYAHWMAAPTAVTFPGGESYAGMRARVRTAAAALRERHARETHVLVSHGGVNRILLAEALGLDDAAIFRLDQSYAAVNVVDHLEGTAVVRVVNLVLPPVG